MKMNSLWVLINFLAHESFLRGSTFSVLRWIEISYYAESISRANQSMSQRCDGSWTGYQTLDSRRKKLFMFSLQHSLVPTFPRCSCAPRLFRPAQKNSLKFLSKHLREKVDEEIAKTVQFAVRTVWDQFTVERSWSSNLKLLILFFSLFDCHKPRAISFCVLLGYFGARTKTLRFIAWIFLSPKRISPKKIEIGKFVLFVKK